MEGTKHANHAFETMTGPFGESQKPTALVDPENVFIFLGSLALKCPEQAAGMPHMPLGGGSGAREAGLAWQVGGGSASLALPTISPPGSPSAPLAPRTTCPFAGRPGPRTYKRARASCYVCPAPSARWPRWILLVPVLNQ